MAASEKAMEASGKLMEASMKLMEAFGMLFFFNFKEKITVPVQTWALKYVFLIFKKTKIVKTIDYIHLRFFFCFFLLCTWYTPVTCLHNTWYAPVTYLRSTWYIPVMYLLTYSTWSLVPVPVTHWLVTSFKKCWTHQNLNWF